MRPVLSYCGFAMWAPWTFAIKGIMAIIMGVTIAAFLKNDPDNKKRLLSGEVVGMIIAGAFMVVGYYAAEGIMYGNWTVPSSVTTRGQHCRPVENRLEVLPLSHLYYQVLPCCFPEFAT